MRLVKNPLQSEAGYSVIEMVGVVSILSLLAVFAIPQVDVLMGSFDRQQARQQFALDIARARSEALAEGVRAVLSIDNDSESYSYGLDRLPFNSPSSADETMITTELPNGITIFLESDLVFDSRGYLIDSDGEFRTETVQLYHDGEEYCEVTVYAAGSVDTEC